MSLSDHDFERIMICASEAGISDVHFHAKSPVFWRRYGDLSSLREYVPSIEDLWRIFTRISSEETREKFIDGNDIDFAWDLEQWRYRVTAYRQKGKLSFAFRTINRLIPELDSLGEAGKIKQFVNSKQGIVLINGMAGMGKTTTMAAFINELNIHKDLHIVTLENPIEYIYPKGRSIISQRELGQDFNNYEDALENILRQDPDVICVADIRDIMTFRMLIDIAKAGKLVVTSTNSCNISDFINKLNKTPKTRKLFADFFVGSISQKLVNNPKGGRLSAAEIIVANQPVKNLIRTGKYEQLLSVMQSSRKEGMQTIEMSLENIGIK